jgi:hypothetical protein
MPVLLDARGGPVKLFISWSGTTSLAVAKTLRDWLPRVVQAVKPWMSEADLEKGVRWESEIGFQLAQTKFGLFCLTPGNLDARWLNFEAGAISKTVERAYVCTYLINLKPTDIQGPLSQFNHTISNKEDTRKLVNTINRALGEEALDDAIVRDAFDSYWPRLQESLAVLASADENPQARRPQEDMIEELLGLARSERQKLEEMLGLVRSLAATAVFQPTALSEQLDKRLWAYMAGVASKHLGMSLEEAGKVAREAQEVMEREVAARQRDAEGRQR